MKRAVLVLSVIIGGCRSGDPVHTNGVAVEAARKDTVEILDAVWRTSTASSIGRYNKRVAWLYLPNADTAALTASDTVRAALSLRGIPASTRLPAGDDTVVFRLQRWAVDTSGTPLIEMRSSSTTVLGYGSRRCRAGSGTIESYRALRTSAGWSAQRVGPVYVGDNVCREIP